MIITDPKAAETKIEVPDYLVHVDTTFPWENTLEHIVEPKEHDGDAIATIDLKEGISLDVVLRNNNGTYFEVAIFKCDGTGNYNYTDISESSIADVLRELDHFTFDDLLEEL